MKLRAFLKQYLKQGIQAFKHPKQMLPTIILTVVWIILGILQIKLKENLPMKVLNFITYAQGGLYGGVVSAIGGILGKVVVAGFVNALIVPLFMGKKPFNGLGNGFKELGKSLGLQGRKALAPFLKGLGSALILYGLSNTTGSFENSMAGIMAAVSLALAMGKKNGFLWNFACSYAQSVTKGKTPDYTGILRALTGMTLGFALGVGMHAAGIGMVGLVGIIALVLGWLLGWGTKKESAVAIALIALTLMPAPPAQAAKKGKWVLVDKKTTVFEGEAGIYNHYDNPPTLMTKAYNIKGSIEDFSFDIFQRDKWKLGEDENGSSIWDFTSYTAHIKGGLVPLSKSYSPGEAVHIVFDSSWENVEGDLRNANRFGILNVYIATSDQGGKPQEPGFNLPGKPYNAFFYVGEPESVATRTITTMKKHGLSGATWDTNEPLVFPPSPNECGFREYSVSFAVGLVELQIILDQEVDSHELVKTTYYYEWDGTPIKGEEAVVEGTADISETEDKGDDMSIEDLIEWIQKQLGEEHSDETATVIRDIIAGLLAGGTAAAAAGGAAGGGMGGGPFGGDLPDGGGEGPDGGKTEEEKEWERQMEEYKKWEKSKLDKYTRKNPDGTITVTDPTTKESSVWYPKEGGGYENENGTTYSDNDLANWLDDRERNSDYYDQNAATAERNLEDWRKRNDELKDMDREAYNKAKAEREQRYKKEDYENMLRDKYLNGGAFDAKAIKKEILKERMAANKDYAEATEWENRMDELINRTKLVQDTCDALINVGANYVEPGGALIQDAYSLAKGAAARGADAAARGKSWKEIGKSAGAGLVEGSVDVLKNHVDDMVDFVGDKLPSSITDAVGETVKEVISDTVENVGTVFFAGTKQVISSALDGKKPAEIVKDVKETCTKEVINIGIGKVVEKVGEKAVTLTAKGMTKMELYKIHNGTLVVDVVDSMETAVEAMSDVWTETQGGQVTDFLYENTGDVIKDVSDKAKSIKSTLRDRARKKYGEKPSEKK